MISLKEISMNNRKLQIDFKRKELEDLWKVTGRVNSKEWFYMEDVFRRAAMLVRNEDLFEATSSPADPQTPYQKALVLAKEILRL
jgi:hypothetical protein